MIELLLYDFYISFLITLTVLVFAKDKITWKEGGIIASFMLILLIFLSFYIVIPLPSMIAILIIYILNYISPGFIEYNIFTDLFIPIYLAFVISLLPLMLLNMAIKSFNISRLNKIFIEFLLFVFIICLILNRILYHLTDIRITDIKLFGLSLIIGVVFFIIDEATNYKGKRSNDIIK